MVDDDRRFREAVAAVLDADPRFELVGEAGSADEANTKAEDVGIYFDDEYAMDCPCCGTRWDRAWREDGEAEPLIYGQPVAEYECMWTPKGKAYAYVYYANGEKVPYLGKEK